MTPENQGQPETESQQEESWHKRYQDTLGVVVDRMPAVRIAVIYGVVSGLWILFSDRIVDLITDNPDLISTLQSYKGIGFIVVTTIGLYSLVLAQTRAIRLRQHRADEQARLQSNIASLGKAVLQVGNLDDIYSLVLERVAEGLSADLAKIAIVEGGREKAKIVEGIGWQAGEIEQIQVPVSPEYLAGRVLQARRPIIVERLVQTDEFKIPDFLIEEGATSSLVAPISNDVPLGVLGIHQKEFRRYTQYESNYLQAAANLLGQAILNFKSREEALLRADLLDAVGQAVIATDPAGIVIYWNDAAENIYGWTRQEAMGRSVVELTPALGQDARAAEIMKQMQLGQPWQGEFRLRRKDGTEFLALVRNSVLRDEQGDIQAIIGVTTDISKIKDTQRALQEATSRLKLLHQIDRHILSGTTMGEMAQTVLDALDQQLHFGSSLVLEYERGGNRVRKLASINDPTSFKDDGWLPMSFIGMPSQPELPQDPFLYFPEIGAEVDSYPVLEEFLEADQNSLLVARMRVEGKSYGSIALSRAEVDAFSEEEIAVLGSVADSLAVGLHEAQLREAERKRAQALESLQRISISLISELDLEELLLNTVSAAHNLLLADEAYLFLYSEEEDRLDFAGGRTQEGVMRETLHQPREDGITARVARSGQRAVFGQVAEHELFSRDFPEWRGSLISQPVIFRGEVLAVLNLSFQRAQHFSSNDLLIVDLLADMAAVAIHNAGQYEFLNQKRTESEALFRVTQRLAGEYQLEDVLQAIVLSVTEVVEGAEASSLWLAQDHDQVLEAQAWHGHADQVMDDLSIPRGQSAVGKVIEDGLPIMIEDTFKDELFEAVGEQAVDQIRCMIGVPIWIGQEVIGALFADNFSRPSAFNQRDFRMLEMLGNQAATAIQRARLFDQIIESRRRLENLSKELVRVQEDERLKLARELHDEMGQLLTGLKLTLEMGQDQLQAGEEPNLAAAVDIAQELLTQVREMSLRLRPSMLDDLGLLPTLLWMVKRYEEQMGLAVEITHENIEGRRFSDEVETTAYRVAQESLTNVARHADTDKAWLTIQLEDDTLRLQVRDEGVGFDPSQVQDSESVQGLSGMGERARLLGGKLNVKSAPGEGTTVTLVLPLEGKIERRSSERQQ